MGVFTSSISLLLKRRYNRLLDEVEHVTDKQQQIFSYLIHHGQRTLYGQMHHYDRIVTIEDYQTLVPIVTYEELYPYIQRIQSGEEDILWPQQIKWMSKSSGTTNNRSKYIPVTSEALEDCHYKAGQDMLAIYLQSHPDSNVCQGKNISIAGSMCKNNSGIMCGDVSAILMSNLPFWARLLSTPSLEDNLFPDWEKKIELIIKTTIQQNVTSITGIPTWTLVLIKNIIKEKQVSYIDEIWPNLELFIHGGVSFISYKDLFKNVLSHPINYLEAYNASEGFFAVQFDDNNDMLLLTNHGIFYEFMSCSDGSVHTINDIELNHTYSLIISTNAGLWRYQIGDTIQFTSLYPHKIKIVGRTKLFINTFGEEVMIHNAETAIARACEETNSTITDYTAGPCCMDNNAHAQHEWAIEFDKFPNDINTFIDILDKTLREDNSDYDAKRFNDIVLGKPKITILPRGFFYSMLNDMGKLGGQHKIPRLNNSRSLLNLIHERLQNTH